MSLDGSGRHALPRSFSFEAFIYLWTQQRLRSCRASSRTVIHHLFLPNDDVQPRGGPQAGLSAPFVLAACIYLTLPPGAATHTPLRAHFFLVGDGGGGEWPAKRGGPIVPHAC